MLIVERAAGDEEVAVLELFEEVDIGGDGRVEDFPFGAAVGERDGLDVLFSWMDEHAADVGTFVVGDQLGVARLKVHRKQAGGVAIAAVFQVKRFAGLVEAGGTAGHGVFRTEFEEVFPLGDVAVLFFLWDLQILPPVRVKSIAILTRKSSSVK